MSLTLAKWTLEHYHRMIDVGLLADRRVELLNGDIVERAPEGEPHAYFSHEAGKYLGKRLGERADIRQAKPITIPTSESEPEPDLAIVQPLGRDYLHHHPWPENIFWLIEFSQTSWVKDTEVKRKTYAAANIPEYWVVNLNQSQLIVFRDPVEGDYQSESRYTKGDIYPLAFPEIAIAVQQIING